MEFKNRALLLGGYVCLFVAGGWAHYARRHADLPFAADELMEVSSFAPVDRVRPAGALPRVTLVFSPSDCGAVIEALGSWNAAHAAGEVQVVGVMIQPPSEPGVFERIVRGAGMDFPVRRAEGHAARAAIRSLGFRSTPVAVVTDPQGRVRLTTSLADGEPGRLSPDALVSLARSLAVPTATASASATAIKSEGQHADSRD